METLTRFPFAKTTWLSLSPSKDENWPNKSVYNTLLCTPVRPVPLDPSSQHPVSFRDLRLPVPSLGTCGNAYGEMGSESRRIFDSYYYRGSFPTTLLLYCVLVVNLMDLARSENYCQVYLRWVSTVWPQNKTWRVWPANHHHMPTSSAIHKLYWNSRLSCVVYWSSRDLILWLDQTTVGLPVDRTQRFTVASFPE